MKTVSKKICSIVLALALCMSLCCTAFAASSPDTTGSITVNGIAGESYSVYQIFDLTYTDDGTDVNDSRSSYSYKVADEWKSFISSYEFEDGTTFELDVDGYLTNAADIAALGDSDIAQFAKDALAYAEDTEITPTQTVVATANQGAEPNPDTGATDGTAYFEDLNLGWYLVSSSLGSLCMLDSTDPDWVINEKNSVPTLEKYVMDVTEKDADDDYTGADDADADDTLQYEIIISDVANGHNVCLHDYMDSELHISNDGGTDDENIHLYVMAEDGSLDEIPSLYGYYEINWDPEDECAFEISFSDEFLATLNDTDQIVVIYTVSIDASGDDFEGDIEEWINHAFLSYGYAQVSPEVEADTYSYGIEVFKYTDTDETLARLLDPRDPDASVDDEDYYIYLEPGTYYVVYCSNPTADTPRYNYLDANDLVASADVNNASYGVADNLYYIENNIQLTNYKSSAACITVETAGYYFIHEDLSLDSYDYSFYVIPDEDAPTLRENITADMLMDMSVGYYEISDKNPLAGAGFVLSYEETTYDENRWATETIYYAILEWEEEQGFWLITGWTTDIDDATVMYTPDDGMIYIEGLAHDVEYMLTEVVTPDGYNKLTSGITVDIVVATDENGNEIYSQFEVHYTYNGVESTGTIDVLNSQGAELPGTGGIGTTIFYIIGGILVVGAVVVLVTRRRMTSES